MIKLDIAHCCDNCVHGGGEAVSKCPLTQKYTHRFETCKKWLGNNKSIKGVEKYMNSVRGHTSYGEKGEVVYGTIYTDNQEQYNEYELDKTERIFIYDNDVKIQFSKACITCDYAEGDKAVRHCNNHNEKVHKLEVCKNWNEDEGKIKRFQTNKKRSKEIREWENNI